MKLTLSKLYKLLVIAFVTFPLTALADATWNNTLGTAKGKTIYFNAWGGSQSINDYIKWAGDRVKEAYGISLKHVKVSDTANVVNRVLAEKTTKKDNEGSVDLVWINGENFKRMKENGLLLSAWTDQLPNYALLNAQNNPAYLYDFTIAVDNQEAPWGKAQLVFMYDSKRLQKPPTSMLEFVAFAKKNPGKLSYPAPPDFYGTTFLKQALSELIDDKSVLIKPVDNKIFTQLSAKLWDYLDQLHPLLWKKGKRFVNIAEMKTMLADGELLISFTFNPNDAANGIETGELPNSVRTYIHRSGTIGNTHFLAIPYNSPNKEAAKVFVNFLLSVEAQLRKADIAIWGDPTVLSMDKLSVRDRQLFSQQLTSPAAINPAELSKTLPELHPSWVEAIEREWQKRYGS